MGRKIRDAVMYLQMYIANVFVERIPIEYEHFITVDEKVSYQQKEARKLYMKHRKTIKATKTEPVFFIHRVPSKMNFMEAES